MKNENLKYFRQINRLLDEQEKLQQSDEIAEEVAEEDEQRYLEMKKKRK